MEEVTREELIRCGYYDGVCEDCGKETLVTTDFCPFALEINEEEVEITVCHDCYCNRADDI